MRQRMQATLAAVMLLSSACTRTGVNAGEEGGTAFVLFTIMLIITIAVLWLILGRED